MAVYYSCLDISDQTKQSEPHCGVFEGKRKSQERDSYVCRNSQGNPFNSRCLTISVWIKAMDKTPLLKRAVFDLIH